MFPTMQIPTQQFKRDTGLNCRPVRGDNRTFPEFQQPKPVGYFSVTTSRDYEPTARQIRYYKPPSTNRFPLELNEGLNLAIKKPESAYDERLDHLLHFIIDNQQKLMASNAELGGRKTLCAEFVCWRGLLRLLMCTPYESREDWCIHVTRCKGTFYMCKRDSEHTRSLRAQETEQQKAMCAWGFKFEQLCLAESPLIEPDTSAPVDECAEFSCVFSTRLQGVELLYGAEMDGIESEQPVNFEQHVKLENLKFVELKVRQGFLSKRQQDTFNRHKTRNWWCQCFLVGVKDVYVGMRNDRGQVRRIEHMEVRSLPKSGANYWLPTTCVSFLIEFFMCLRSIMAEVDCPHTTYEFYFNAEQKRITYEALRGRTAHSFLPDYYVSLLRQWN